MRQVLNRARSQFGRRVRQINRLVRTEGLTGFTNRLRTYVVRHIRPRTEPWPVKRTDVLAADIARPMEWREPAVKPNDPISINWVMIAPGPGSGGHATIFRIIRYLEEHGYNNKVYIYDPYVSDHEYFTSIIRENYGFHGTVRRVEDGLEDAHAIVATGWETAYPVYNATAAGKRYYFVQDFEPYFYPVSSFGVLAKNTYRMGFHAITAGQWLSQKLTTEFGMSSSFFEFGCDTRVYRLEADGKRDGVAFYYRPAASRRGSEIALMAIEKFASRRPDVRLHFYGSEARGLPFSIVNHGIVSPAQLNDIYNQCFCGLSLSLTNVSLVPHEMLAAGCIPIVNDADHNRIVLQNDYVRYVALDPHAIAGELERVVAMHDFESVSRSGAASVRSLSWNAAGEKVDSIFRETLLKTGAKAFAAS